MKPLRRIDDIARPYSPRPGASKPGDVRPMEFDARAMLA